MKDREKTVFPMTDDCINKLCLWQRDSIVDKVCGLHMMTLVDSETSYAPLIPSNNDQLNLKPE